MPPATLTPVKPQETTPAAGHGASAVDAEAWKKKSFWQLFNISIGFLGIQFAWAIQMGQMSPILERLGSNPQLLGLISCAGPVTGVLVQPIIGALSDGCGLKMGRRRPFLLAGALLTAFSLILMPNSNSLLMAAILLWILDASINTTQGPYRALVPDVVHKTQQATAYSMMSLTIGLGSVAAFLIAFAIPSLHTLFYLGASVMLLAMAWTTFSTPEPAPEAAPAASEGPKENFFVTTIRSIGEMPKEGLKLCIAHSFTWFGLMCLFTFFSVFVPHQVFGAANAQSASYEEGVKWAQLCFAAYNAVCFLFSALIGKLCDASSKKAVHSFGLLCMAASMIGMFFITDKYMAMGAMALIGIGWATTLSIPFALLSDHLPKGKEGVMMGTFNIFIAAPGVLANLLVGQIVGYFNDNVAVALIVGGISVLVSMVLLQLVTERKPGADVETGEMIAESSTSPV